MPVPAVPTASEAVSPFAPTTSSVLPSAAVAEERIDWLIVSPVASDGGEDHRRQHQPDHDQRGAAPPPARVPDTEPEEDPVAQRKHHHHPEQQQQRYRQHLCERADRDPEQLAHAITQP